MSQDPHPTPEDPNAEMLDYLKRRDADAALRRSRIGVGALFVVLAVIAIILVWYASR